MGARSKVPTHRLYVFFVDESKTISTVHQCISSAWFHGSQYMKKHNVKEIRIIKIKPILK